MRHLILLSLFFLTLASCQKSIHNKSNDSGYLENVEMSLRDSLSKADFETLDFNKTILSKIDDNHKLILRIPFKGKSIAKEFIVVSTDLVGNISSGRIVDITGSPQVNRQIGQYVFNGMVSLKSLDRSMEVKSDIIDGYVRAFHQNTSSMRVESLPSNDGTVLPEVIVVAYVHYSDGISFSTWVSIMSFLNNFDSGGGSSTYYDYSDPSYGGPTGGGGSSGGGITYTQPLEVEAEYIYSLPGIDLNKFFKCFDNVPSTGATYSIKLCTDIPSNNDPNASVNYSAASAGHTFLTITKSNGSNSVTQSFGFYPQQQPSYLDPFADVTSEIKDNGLQEINASLQVNITESQFNTIKQNAISWSSRSYNLADYNCSDFAIDVFNSVRSNPLIVVPHTIYLPGSPNVYSITADPLTVSINKSPQMLFQKLREMKNGNGPEAGSIAVDQTHNSFAPLSKGECN